MKNLLGLFVFIGLLCLGIVTLYDCQARNVALTADGRRTPEKYTLPTQTSINPKQIASLDELNRERRELVNSVVPSVVSVKTSKKISVRRQMQLDPFEYFFPNTRRGGSSRDEALVQNSLGSGVIV